MKTSLDSILTRQEFLRRTLKGSLAVGCLGLTSHAGPPPTDLIYWSATKLAKAIRDKEVSSEEAVMAYLARIEQVNPKLNAVVQRAADRALQEARAADAALESGQTTGPLHGVPVTIKDSF